MSVRSSSSSSSSSSVTEEITVGSAHTGSEIFENVQRASPRLRQVSSTASQNSALATGTPYDSVSIATTNTGLTNVTNVTANTAVSQHQSTASNIPIIPPPVLQESQPQQLLTAGVNVASAQQQQQQQQQQRVQSQISPYSLSSTTSSAGSLSTAGGGSLPQQPQQQQQSVPNYVPNTASGVSVQQQQHGHSDVTKATFTQVDTNRDEFRQWAQGADQPGGQNYPQRPPLASQLPPQQPFNPLLGPDAFKDVILNIDYSVIEAQNIALQSAGDITAEALGVQSGGQFDVAKAIFQQVDTNHDGSISRDEFRHWAQNATPNYGAQQTYSNAGNYGGLYAGATPEIANILQQSGLGPAYGNF